MLVEVSTNLALQMSSIFVFLESPRLQAGEDVNCLALFGAYNLWLILTEGM